MNPLQPELDRLKAQNRALRRTCKILLQDDQDTQERLDAAEDQARMARAVLAAKEAEWSEIETQIVEERDEAQENRSQAMAVLEDAFALLDDVLRDLKEEYPATARGYQEKVDRLRIKLDSDAKGD